MVGPLPLEYIHEAASFPAATPCRNHAQRNDRRPDPSLRSRRWNDRTTIPTALHPIASTSRQRSRHIPTPGLPGRIASCTTGLPRPIEAIQTTGGTGDTETGIRNGQHQPGIDRRPTVLAGNRQGHGRAHRRTAQTTAIPTHRRTHGRTWHRRKKVRTDAPVHRRAVTCTP